MARITHPYTVTPHIAGPGGTVLWRMFQDPPVKCQTWEEAVETTRKLLANPEFVTISIRFQPFKTKPYQLTWANRESLGMEVAVNG